MPPICATPAEIGRSAGERAIKRLGARKMPTGNVPVIFDPRVARSFLSHLLGPISGPSIARGTSFLKDKLGQRIFPRGDHASSRTRTASAACARSRSTAKASPTSAAR